MPDYNVQIQGPQLGGLDQGVSPVNRGGANAAAAALVSTVGKIGANIYGSSQAKKAGAAIGGEGETYEAAGLAADAASTELEGLRSDKQSYQGSDVTPDQAKDLRDQVFGRVLTNQKRIQSAVDRGLISSTEATARLSVLRNEALSNPLVAPFQHELDNALYKTTGGSGTTFAATAAEAQAAAQKKGQLAAIEETQKAVTGLITTGLAANETQALSLIAQDDAQKRSIAFMNQKKEALGLNSQEVYAANQVFQQAQATTAAQTIASWQASGGDANQKQQLQLKLVNDGEVTKTNIRNHAYDKSGNLIVTADVLASQLAEVDKRTKDFVGMLDDQSGTKKLMDTVAQLNASMSLKSAEVNVDLAKRFPVLYALKDQPVVQQHFLNTLTSTNTLKTKWISSSNPIMKAIAQLPNSELNDKVASAQTSFINGAPTTSESVGILSTTLLEKGGAKTVDAVYGNHPEATLTTLRNTPFLIKDVATNTEWLQKASTPEGRDQLAAVVESAASRALVSSVYEPDRYGSYQKQTSGRRYQIDPKFEVPAVVTVTQNPQPINTGGGRGNGNAVGKKYEEWTIDTGGVIVSDLYKSELVNAYKLGTTQPSVWNEDFKTMDEWLNHLFTRPSSGK